MKTKIAVVDDEPLARKRISNLLSAFEGIEIREIKNGLEAVDVLIKERFDLLFLDVQMPELNGIEVLEKLPREKLPVIIFVTAYDKFALKALEFHAFDYLLKPFDDDRFYSAYSGAVEFLFKLDNRKYFLELKSLFNNLYPESKKVNNNHLETITIKKESRIYLLQTNNIVRIKAEGKYLKIFAENEIHSLRNTLIHIESKLDPKIFIRISRSVIINKNYILEMEHWYKNEYCIKLVNGEKFNSSGGFRENLEPLLKN